MQLVERLVQCFSCTCRVFGNELASYNVDCHACHFRVDPSCTTCGVCMWCRTPERVSPNLAPKARNFSFAWELTRPWLRYDPVDVLMWCEACRAHPQLGISMPFVQGTSLHATAVVERGWSTVAYLKGLNRTRMQSATAKHYLLCKFHGPCFSEWAPLHCVEKWFMAGKRQKCDILHRSCAETMCRCGQARTILSGINNGCSRICTVRYTACIG